MDLFINTVIIGVMAIIVFYLIFLVNKSDKIIENQKKEVKENNKKILGLKKKIADFSKYINNN